MTIDKATGTIIGMDGHLRTCDLCGMDRGGTLIRRFRDLPTKIDALKKAIGVFPAPVTLVIEESAMAQWFVEQLTPLVDRIISVDPRRNRLIAEADTKSDPVDAYKLANLFRIGAIVEVYHSIDPARVAFRRAVQQYETIVREIVKMKNRVRKSYNQYGVDPSATQIYHPQRREGAMEALPDVAQVRLRAWYRVLDELMAARKEILSHVHKMSRAFEEVGRFRTIPGIGIITACEFSAYIQTPDRFQHKSQLCSYGRLGVVDRSSAGKQLGRRHLSRQGLGVLKSATRRAFIGAMKRNSGKNAVAHYYLDLRKRNLNPVHARLTTQRKILTTVWAMWKRKEAFDPDRFLTHTQRV